MARALRYTLCYFLSALTLVSTSLGIGFAVRAAANDPLPRSQSEDEYLPEVTAFRVDRQTVLANAPARNTACDSYDRVEIQYRTFISPDVIETDPNPVIDDFHQGDKRCFGFFEHDDETMPSSRSFQRTVVNVCPVVPRGEVLDELVRRFGQSDSFEDDPDGSDVESCTHMCDDCSFPDGQWCLLETADHFCEDTAMEDWRNKLDVIHNRVSDNEVTVRFDVVGFNPCEISAPAIDAHFKIHFRQVCSAGNTGSIEFKIADGGLHDGFPWHELYLNGHLVYKHDPCCTGEGPGSLFGPGEWVYTEEDDPDCPHNQLSGPLDSWQLVPEVRGGRFSQEARGTAVCCGTDGSCAEASESCCTDAGGTFFQSATCGDIGLCCPPNGICLDTTAECCDVAGGTFSLNSLCAQAVAGACCLGDGTCSETNELCCQAAGGVPPDGTGQFEPGSVCSEIAACLFGSDCIETTEGCCDQGGGTFDADNGCGSYTEGCSILPNNQARDKNWTREDPLVLIRAKSDRNALARRSPPIPMDQTEMVFQSAPQTALFAGGCNTSPSGANVTISNGVLTISGTSGISIRLALDANPNPTFLDIFDPYTDTTADCQVDLGDFNSIVINSGDGDDVIAFDDTNGAVVGTLPLTINTGDGMDTLIGGTGNLTVDEVIVLLNMLQSSRDVMDRVDTLVEMVGATENLAAGGDDMISNVVTLLDRTRTDFVLPAADFVNDLNNSLIQPTADEVIAIRDGLITQASDFIRAADSGLAAQGMLLKEQAEIELELGAYLLRDLAVDLKNQVVAFKDSAFVRLHPPPNGASDLIDQIQAYVDMIDPLLDNCETLEDVEPEPTNDVCPDIQDLVDCMEFLIEDYERLGEKCEAEGDVFAETTLATPALETAGAMFEQDAVVLEMDADAFVLEAIAFSDMAEEFAQALQDRIQNSAAVFEARAGQIEQDGAAFESDVSSQIEGKAAALENEAAMIITELQQVMTAALDILEGGIPADRRRGRVGCSGIQTTTIINGGPGPNVLLGTPGNDLIHGNGGLDLIIGGPGDDILFGDDGFDLVFGGSGTNEIHGGKGIDILVGGSDVDCIFGDDGLDLIIGLGDNDELEGGNYTDIILGGHGDDIIRGGDGIDLLIGDLPLLGETGNDTIFGDNCIDVLIGGDGNDIMDGGPGQKIEIGAAFSIELGNVVLGGSGMDTMYGTPHPTTDANGIDVMIGGGGDDTMHGGNGGLLKIGNFEFMLGNVMLGGTGDDTITSKDGIDVLFGGTGNDDITAGKGFKLDLFDGNFELYLGDLLFGGQDNDTLHGDDPGAPPADQDLDLLFGGTGNDIINGYNGGDLTVNNFTIKIGNPSFGGEGDDEIYDQDGIGFAFGGQGNDIIQCGKGHTFVNQAGTFEVAFGDFLFGQGGEDELHGNAPTSSTGPDDGDLDIIFGGPDGDFIYGGGGGLVVISPVSFVFGDIIFGEGGPDVIRGDVQFPGGNDPKNGIDLIFGGAGGDDIDTGPGSKIDISGAVVINFGSIVFGGEGDDVIVGSNTSASHNAFPLGGGIDLVFAGIGADTIDTGSGIDLVFGGQGDDEFELGDGGAIYIGGVPPIIPFGNIAFGGGGSDIIRSGGLITEIDLLFGNRCGDIINAGGGLLNLCFGNANDDTINGESGLINLCFGGRGNDTINLPVGVFNLAFGGSGNDMINAGDALVNILFGNSGDDEITSGGGINLDLVFGNDGYDTLVDEGGVLNVLFGNDQADEITCATGAVDLIFGNKGDDRIVGGGGALNMIFGNDGGDQIDTQAAINLAFGNSGDDKIIGSNVIIFFGNSGDDYLEGGNGLNLLFGNNEDDKICGGAAVDLLFGGQHRDELIGGSGLDVLFGGSGNDTLFGGDSVDVLFGNLGDDEVYGEGGSDLACGNKGDDVVSGGLAGDLLFGNKGNDEVFGDDGRDWIFGNQDSDEVYAGNDGDRDRCFGNRGDDFLFRCQSNDKLYGGQGMDIKTDNTCDNADVPVADCVPPTFTETCRPVKNGLSCTPTACVSSEEVCVPTTMALAPGCTLDGRACEEDDDCACGDTCEMGWRIIDCDCRADECSIELSPAESPQCVNGCDSGGPCTLSEVGGQFRCDCPPDSCQPTADGLGCEAVDCPFGNCVPTLVEYDGVCSGSSTPCTNEPACNPAAEGPCFYTWQVLECDCIGSDGCRTDVPEPSFSLPPAAGSQCVDDCLSGPCVWTVNGDQYSCVCSMRQGGLRNSESPTDKVGVLNAAPNPPQLPLPPHDVAKNRYISFAPDEDWAQVAIEVTIPPCRRGWVAPAGFLGAPANVAMVVDEPVYRDWPENVIHVTGCVVAPELEYELRAVTIAGDVSDPLVLQTASPWGDIVGTYLDGTWTPPNGVVDSHDLAAVTAKSKQLPAPHVTWVDLAGQFPDYRVNQLDIDACADAIDGESYPPTGFMFQTLTECTVEVPVIPSVSTWGLTILALLVLTCGTLRLRSLKKAH